MDTNRNQNSYQLELPGIPPAGSRFVTIKQAAEQRPAFPEGALRDIKFKAEDRVNSKGELIKGNGSGAAGVWVKIGAKVLLDLVAFDAWVAAHKTNNHVRKEG